MAIVLLIVHPDLITMDKLVSLVWILKVGMELTALIGAAVVKFGTSLLRHVCAQPVSSGMDMHASSVPAERHGILTLKVANAQFHQLGME